MVDLKRSPTLREIIGAHEERRAYIQYLFLARYILYPVGFLLTWIGIRIGLTTESAAWLSGLAGLLGYLCLISGHKSLVALGICFLIFFEGTMQLPQFLDPDQVNNHVQFQGFPIGKTLAELCYQGLPSGF